MPNDNRRISTEKATELLAMAESLAKRVIEKVDGTAADGRRMGSKETYAQCKAFLAALEQWRKE